MLKSGIVLCFCCVLMSVAGVSCRRPSDNTTEPLGGGKEETMSAVEANNAFALDMYQRYAPGNENIFFSPWSVWSAFAMVYEGSKGLTAKEIREVFRFSGDLEIMRKDFARLYVEINRPDREYVLSTANALWAQKDFPFYEKYFSVVEKNYGARISNLDFAKETEASRLIINRWVEDNTNNKIKNLIPSGAIDALTRMVLTNAVYFKGEWVKQFDPEKTGDADFILPDAASVKVPMMQRTDDKAVFPYMENDYMQMLEMPYAGEELSMLILLPPDKDIRRLEQKLTSANLERWRSALDERRVDVYVPKFKFEKKYFMVETLSDMGLREAFTGRADFSGMADTRDLLISDVIHQAFVEVAEEGTEAAAATAVIIRLTSAPTDAPVIPVFRADHPFLFIIQQRHSGNILFMGRVSNPLLEQ